MILARGRKTLLREDVRHVFLDRADGEDKPSRYRGVRPAFRHQQCREVRYRRGVARLPQRALSLRLTTRQMMAVSYWRASVRLVASSGRPIPHLWLGRR